MADDSAPKLLGFGVANYRSFDQTGFVIRDPKKLNVFIGKNNCGKSNVLRALALLRRARHIGAPVVGIDPLVDHYRRYESPPSVTVTIPADSFFLHEGNLGNYPSYLEQYKQTVGDSITVRWQLGNIDLDGTHPFECFSRDDLEAMYKHAMRDGATLHSPTKDRYFKHFSSGLMNLAIQALSQFDRFLSIPVFREIEPTTDAEETPEHFSGRAVIRRLKSMQHPQRGRESERRVFEIIQRFLCTLLGTEVLMEVPDGRDEIVANMHGNRLALESYGTGVHHLLILASALALHDRCTVTIEEPEIHLHPDLQRKFLRFLAKETTNTYYITTHSNVFLDARPDVSSVPYR